MVLLRISDIVALRPLLRWLLILSRKETELNRMVIRDCLSLDKSNALPWRKFVEKRLLALGRPELFSKPEEICKQDIRWVKLHF